MGVGEDPAGAGPPDQERSGVSRRDFVQGAVKAGLAAGAVAWVAPQLSSVALAQEVAGSTPPGPPPDPPDPGVTATRGAVEDPGSAAAATVQSGTLPQTGIDAVPLAVAGGAAVATGEAVLLVKRGLAARRPSAPPLADPAPEAGE